MVEKKTTEDLRRLIIENPDLEIVPFISEDASSADYCYSIGSIGKSCVDEWVVDPYDEEHIMMRSTCFDDYAENYRDERYEDVSDELIRASYDALDWCKAIIVRVEAF